MSEWIPVLDGVEGRPRSVAGKRFDEHRPEDNHNPVGRAFYGFSTVVCTKASRAQEVGREREHTHMQFIQILEIRTSKFEKIQSLDDEWRTTTEGKRTLRRSLVCRDRNGKNRNLVPAFFFDVIEDQT